MQQVANNEFQNVQVKCFVRRCICKMAGEVFSSSDISSDKESTLKQTSLLTQIRNLTLNICCPYSKQIDGLDQSLCILFYLTAIVLTFLILFITKELSLENEDNEETSHFVQEHHINILLISYMTPAILWTICLFMIKNDTHMLVFDNNTVRFERVLFLFIYLLGGVLFVTNILQATFQLRCGEIDTTRSLCLYVEALFVLTQILFQVMFLNASFFSKSFANLAVIYMIGSNFSMFIHGIFTRSSHEMQPSNHTINRNDSLVPSSYCTKQNML